MTVHEFDGPISLSPNLKGRLPVKWGCVHDVVQNTVWRRDPIYQLTVLRSRCALLLPSLIGYRATVFCFDLVLNIK
jgi:hypothetical protein